MKTTTKKLFIGIFSLAIFATSSVNAQMNDSAMDSKGVRLGFGLSGGIFPNKSAMDYGFGADVKMQFDLAKAVSITASAGYTRLMPASDLLDDIDFVPLKGGVKVFPIGGMYLATELGAGIGLAENEKINFIYTGGVGYAWNNGLDISARYEGYVNDSSSATYFMKTGQYALRIAYGFKL